MFGDGNRQSAAAISLSMLMLSVAGCGSRQPVVTAVTVQSQNKQVVDDISSNPHMSDQQKAAALAQVQRAQTTTP